MHRRDFATYFAGWRAPWNFADADTTLLTIGGDHTIALPLLRAAHRAMAARGK